MAWLRSGDKPLSQPMMVRLLAHICVSRPQCFKFVVLVSIYLCTSMHPIRIITIFFGMVLSLAHDDSMDTWYFGGHLYACRCRGLQQAQIPWWRHQMKKISALLAPCTGNSPVTGEFPSQRPVTRIFDVFFDLRLNKRLSQQSWGLWFETPLRPLWRHCNGLNIVTAAIYIIAAAQANTSVAIQHTDITQMADCGFGVYNCFS